MRQHSRSIRRRVGFVRPVQAELNLETGELEVEGIDGQELKVEIGTRGAFQLQSRPNRRLDPRVLAVIDELPDEGAFRVELVAGEVIVYEDSEA